MEAYPEPCQISKMALFAKIVNGFQPLNIFAKNQIFDVWQGSGYTSVVSGCLLKRNQNNILWWLKRVQVSQPAFAYLNLTIETLEQGIKYDQS